MQSALLVLLFGVLMSLRDICNAEDSPFDVSLKNACESPSLPSGQFHVVIVAHEQKNCFTNYLWDLGVTNAHVFVYRRVASEIPLRTWQGPCGMVVQERLLLPNHGKELSAFSSYVLEHFENPPRSFALIHSHGPHGYHSDCASLISRVRFAYRGLASPVRLPNAAEFATHMVTLTRVGTNNDPLWLKDSLRFIAAPSALRKLLGAKEEISDVCHAIFDKWSVNVTFEAFPNGAGSCCASFVLPWDRIFYYAKGFYVEMMEFSLMPYDDYWTSRVCWEYNVYAWYKEKALTPHMQSLYQQAQNISSEMDFSRCQKSQDKC